MKILVSVFLGFFIIFLGRDAYAQTTPPITSSGLNTQISAPVTLPGGAVQHNITGGTRPGGGANLFHSFGEFGIPTNNIANFLNESAHPTTNILSRVTGGNPSNILGTIQTQGFGNANLFLMNPAGIVFGPNASLNVGGAAHFTTADYLRLSDGVQFTALPSPQDALLSVAPVAAFGFLKSNPASITVHENIENVLMVSDGQTLSLVGGNISIGSGLSASGGKIALASVASPGEVLADTYANFPNVNGQLFTTMGNITLWEGTTVDVSGDTAGTVIIRGGQLMITNSTISADTGDSDGAPLAVDIQVSGDISIADSQGITAITARTDGDGNAGDVRLTSGNLKVNSTSLSSFSVIDTHTTTGAAAGKVNIQATENLEVTGELNNRMYFIDSGTIGEDGGQGGDVRINAGNIQFVEANINTGDRSPQNTGDDTGSGGALSITADAIEMTRSVFSTDGFNFGKAGDIAISSTGEVKLKEFSQLTLAEYGGGGSLTIVADSLIVDASALDLETLDGRGIGTPWVGVTVNARSVQLLNGGTIRSQTVGDGAAGDIYVTATEHFILSDDPTTDGAINRPSGLFTNSRGEEASEGGGAAGSIFVTTGRLEISGGARFDSTTQSNGRGGDLTVIATDSISLSGQRPFPIAGDDFFGIGSTLPSGIFSRTVGEEFCTGPCGEAGNISITTESLSISQGGVLDSGTTNNGVGGAINVNVSENISIAGTLGGVFSRSTGTKPGSGAGGEISLMAGQNFTLNDGATVSASSEGLEADAGNIQLAAADTILIDKATITTEAAQASGGDIKLTANDTIQLVDSTIESSVQGDATTGGGDISLDPDFIILQNSQILAKAVAGKGGNIDLVANKAVLVDSQSNLDASSQLGISGTVTIESPIQVLSGTIAPLPDQPVNVATLYAARCVAGEGGHFSTFVDSKSDSVAPTPGTFLASPFLPVTDGLQQKTGHSHAPSSEVTLSGPETSIHLATYTPPVLFAQATGQPVPCP